MRTYFAAPNAMIHQIDALQQYMEGRWIARQMVRLGGVPPLSHLPRSRHSHPGSKTSYHQGLEMRDFPHAVDRSAKDASPPITSPSIRALFGPCHHGPVIPASDPLLRMKARKAQHHLSLTLNTAFLTRKPNAPDVHYSDGVSVTAAPVVITGAERIKNHLVRSAQAVR